MTVLEQIEQPLEQKEVTGSSFAQQLTTGSLLARNTVWNLVGQFTPMLVAVFVIPKLVHALGTDRFGALTIAWMVVGYFSLFDLGLGRALTNLVAQKLGSNDEDALPSLIWTANLLMLGLGLLGVVIFAAASPIVVHRLLKIPPVLQPEILKSFLILSLAVPFVISTTGFRGVLEARQEFKVINTIRVPLGIVTFIAPLIVIPFSKSLVPIVTLLTLARMVFCGLHVFFVFRSVPALRHRFAVDWKIVPRLLGFGGWMTVSNVLSPLMMYSDRLLIGSLLSLTAVAYYATPYEVAIKLIMIPAAVVSVLFPAFSTALISDPGKVSTLFHRGLKYIAFALFPIVFVIMLFAHEGLGLWLGANFALHSTAVLQWIALGVFVNALSFVPYALIQGAGRADLTGKLHMCEFPGYLALVWLMTKHFGITGAAIAWCTRLAIDCVCLVCLSYRFCERPPLTRTIWVISVGMGVALALAPLVGAIALKIVCALLLLFAFVIFAWKFNFTISEKLFLRRRMLTMFLPTSDAR